MEIKNSIKFFFGVAQALLLIVLPRIAQAFMPPLSTDQTNQLKLAIYISPLLPLLTAVLAVAQWRRGHKSNAKLLFFLTLFLSFIYWMFIRIVANA